MWVNILLTHGHIQESVGIIMQFTLKQHAFKLNGPLIHRFLFLVNTCTLFNQNLNVYECRRPIVCIDLCYYIYIGNLNICGFWYTWEFLEPISIYTEGQTCFVGNYTQIFNCTAVGVPNLTLFQGQLSIHLKIE